MKQEDWPKGSEGGIFPWKKPQDWEGRGGKFFPDCSTDKDYLSVDALDRIDITYLSML